MKVETPFDRVIVIVLDSVGIGELPDAADYGDVGASTLPHIAEAVGGLALPNLGRWGLGNIAPIAGTPPAARPTAAWGKMAERSAGKDTTAGHWELMGLEVTEAFSTWPNGFSEEILDELRRGTGRGVLGNKVASGTVIIEELGEEHVRTGDLIVYTSADSVLQIAAHEEIVPLEELYAACKLMREVGDRERIGRVIARPFVGGPGSWQRTYNRHDFSLEPHGPTVLDRLVAANVPVLGIGKIRDIFANHGVPESISTSGNTDGIERTIEAMERFDDGFVFVNLVDFDMLYGHRNNPEGYARALEEFDAAIPRIKAATRPGDLLMVTADHGNDPTFPGTDHCREYVPLLVWGPQVRPAELGIRQSFADVGATVAAVLGVTAPEVGTSFLPEIGLKP
ncbi:MAG: phosphopentomutase [bacterium]